MGVGCEQHGLVWPKNIFHDESLVEDPLHGERTAKAWRDVRLWCRVFAHYESGRGFTFSMFIVVIKILDWLCWRLGVGSWLNKHGTSPFMSPSYFRMLACFVL